MKKVVVMLTLVGCLLASSALAYDQTGKLGLGGQWLYATGVAFNMKTWASPNTAHEFYAGLDLVGFPILAGYKYDFHFLAGEQLTPYIYAGGSFIYVPATVFNFTAAGNVGAGIEYFLSNDMSLFADGGLAIGYRITGNVGEMVYDAGAGGGIRFYLGGAPARPVVVPKVEKPVVAPPAPPAKVEKPAPVKLSALYLATDESQMTGVSRGSVKLGVGESVIVYARGADARGNWVKLPDDAKVNWKVDRELNVTPATGPVVTITLTSSTVVAYVTASMTTETGEKVSAEFMVMGK